MTERGFLNRGKRLVANMVLRYLEYIYSHMVVKRCEALRDCLEKSPSAILLDCGCNAGHNTEILAKCIGTERVIGVELNARVLAEAKVKGIRGVRADLNEGLPLRTGSVDVATVLDVLEHLVETKVFVSALYRVLTPGGYVVIATPNLASWHNIFALFLGIQPFSGPNITTMIDADDLNIVRRMHRKTYGLPEEGQCEEWGEAKFHRYIVVVAYRSLIKLLEREGFVIEKATGFGYFPLPPILAALLCKIDISHSHHLVIKARKPTGSEG